MHLGVLRDLLAEEGGEVLLGVGDHHVDEHALETVGERHELRLVVVLAVLWVGAREGDADEAREELVQDEVVVGLRRLLRPRRREVRGEAVGELGERPLLHRARLREQRVLRLLLGLRLDRRVAALALALLEGLRRVRRVRLREHVGEGGEVDELRLELRVLDEVVELLELHFQRVRRRVDAGDPFRVLREESLEDAEVLLQAVVHPLLPQRVVVDVHQGHLRPARLPQPELDGLLVGEDLRVLLPVKLLGADHRVPPHHHLFGVDAEDVLDETLHRVGHRHHVAVVRGQPRLHARLVPVGEGGRRSGVRGVGERAGRRSLCSSPHSAGTC